jgi:hypothetical protein
MWMWDMRNQGIRIVLLWFVAGFLVCNPMHLGAEPQAMYELEDVQVGRSLSAIVTRLDGGPIEGVAVAEMTPGWQETLRTTKSDAAGTFTFEPVKGRKIYYFRLTMDKMKPLQFRMKVDSKKGITIKVQMEIATWI